MANLLSKIFKRNINEAPETFQRSTDADYWNPIMGTLGYSSYNNYSTSKSLKLSVVYRCVEVVSLNIAVLPLQTYNVKGNRKYKEYNDLYYLLNVQPSGTMSAYNFKKFLVQQVLLKGNCYIHISRSPDLSIQSFEILDSDYIRVLIDGITVNYNSRIVSGIKTYQDIKTGVIYDDMDIIHLMGMSSNGLVGLSVISSAALALEISYNSEVHASNFFESGANASGYLKPVAGAGNLTNEQALSAKEKLKNATSSKNQKSGTISILDKGFDFVPTSVSPRDSQLLESRAFNTITICQFFGVNPQKVFDYSNSSYSTVEASQLDFLNSTILSWCEMIETEFYRKLYDKVEYPYTELEFDTSKLLRLDAAAQASYFSQMFNLGAMTVNDIRSQINAEPLTDPAANRSFIGVQVQPLDNLVSEQGQVNNQIDNKIK
jgi:HK97 family phage portal protein